MNKKHACIIRIKGEIEEKICIGKEEFVIGRMDGKVDYVVSNAKVSKMHAKIIYREGKYYITDLCSTNKTYVNDVECPSGKMVALEDGTVISIAGEKLIFMLL